MDMASPTENSSLVTLLCHFCRAAASAPASAPAAAAPPTAAVAAPAAASAPASVRSNDQAPHPDKFAKAVAEAAESAQLPRGPPSELPLSALAELEAAVRKKK